MTAVRAARRWWRALALATVAGCAAAVAGQPSPAQPVPRRELVFGHSVQGRPLRAVALGEAGAARRILVVGCIHGNECAGKAIVRRLSALRPPPGTGLWLVADANPDGSAARTRQNARGVDLNRNFSFRWRPLDRPGGPYWSGPRPLSEPESRALRRLILRVRPDVTVWYHQRLRLVDEPEGDATVAWRYARAVGLPLRRLPRYPGSATAWQNHWLRPATAFVVELPDGEVHGPALRRHAAAIFALAGGPAAAAGRRSPEPRPRTRAVTAPPIVQRRIPFGARRRAEMAAYSGRHYGHATWRLTRPRVIVQHYSVTATARAVYNTFAPDRRDPELHELPGTCAHFVVARDGTVQQLVGLDIRCRHAVGLNHTAIGIEHVGFSERQVLGNRRQVAASLRLTRWLRCRFDIGLSDVIGHAESLSSPYHLERIARLRRQTHGDFRRQAMDRYRAFLARQPCP